MDFTKYLVNDHSFECANQKFKNEDIENLLKFLSKHSHITTLNFSRNKIGNTATRVGSEVIRKLMKIKFPKLTYLNLEWNSFGVDGMKEIATSIKNGHLGNLKYLNIENNKIGTGIKYLGQKSVIEKFSDLEVLNMAKNMASSELFENFIKIIEIVDLPKLKHLDVGCGYIGNSGAVAFAKLLQNNKLANLHYVNFKPSRIGKEGKEALLEMAKKHTNLKLVV